MSGHPQTIHSRLGASHRCSAAACQELFGNRAIRQGDWKLLYLLQGAGGTGDWQLFNLREDPAELHDLSKKHPEKREAMLKLWDEYVMTNGVVLTEDGPFAKRKP